jgi:hypothetical protein
MKRIVMMFALTALLVVALSMSAFSASAVPFKQQCRDAGGTPTQNKECDVAAGQSAGFETTRHGNQTTCTNPGGQETNNQNKCVERR